MVEILIALVILAIMAVLVIPTAGQGASRRLSHAARMVAGDLGYARHASVVDAENAVAVQFDEAGQGYELVRAASPGVVLAHPGRGGAYRVRFGEGAAGHLAGVTLTVAGASDDRLAFGPLGGLESSETATITLQAEQREVAMEVHPATGEVTVGNVADVSQ